MALTAVLIVDVESVAGVRVVAAVCCTTGVAPKNPTLLEAELPIRQPSGLLSETLIEAIVNLLVLIRLIGLDNLTYEKCGGGV
jgi:hypothetical protein